MSDKARTKPATAAKAPRKTTNILPFLAVAAVVFCSVVVFLTQGNDVSSGNAGNATTSGSSDAIAIGPGESLVIPTADISEQASFHPVTVNGTTMEVIAVRDSTGNIRTAFNTCQVCYDSGRGYYAQSGKYLVCQNCGNRFSMDQVGIISGGCNPWPIFAENTTVTVDSISISYNFLVEVREIFANWKSADISFRKTKDEGLTVAETALTDQTRQMVTPCCDCKEGQWRA